MAGKACGGPYHTKHSKPWCAQCSRAVRWRAMVHRIEAAWFADAHADAFELIGPEPYPISAPMRPRIFEDEAIGSRNDGA